jgi:hypothetical protein
LHEADMFFWLVKIYQLDRMIAARACPEIS